MPETVLETATLDQLSADLGGDPEPVRDLIESYLQEAPVALARLRSAIERQSATEIASAAHSLKSSSAMLGAKQVSDLAVQLEKLGRSGSVKGASETFATMTRLFPHVERELRGWMSR